MKQLNNKELIEKKKNIFYKNFFVNYIKIALKFNNLNKIM